MLFNIVHAIIICPISRCWWRKLLYAHACWWRQQRNLIKTRIPADYSIIPALLIRSHFAALIMASRPGRPTVHRSPRRYGICLSLSEFIIDLMLVERLFAERRNLISSLQNYYRRLVRNAKEKMCRRRRTKWTCGLKWKPININWNVENCQSVKALQSAGRWIREYETIYRVAQNKIPHQTICNFSATS